MKAAPVLIAALCGLLIVDASAQAKRKRPTPAATPPPATHETPQARATVVVYNEAAPDSRELAHYYAKRRGIPEANIVPLTCSLNEEISRAEFDRDIAAPLRKTFEEKKWWQLRETSTQFGRVERAQIRFVALIRGIPLKIAQLNERYEGDNRDGPPQMVAHNSAAVDSELSVLGVFSRHISGGLNNPYYRSYQRFSDSALASLLLVCRLDGPTPEIVRRMIDDSIAAEQRGLRGMAYIDARGTQDPQLIEGDKWMLNAATIARRRGVPTILDTGAGLYPESYPMNHAALYVGWYTEHATGPFLRPDFRFAQGAVAVHLHSFSGLTLRSPRQYWCGPLLAAGAAATIGNVYEPYLAFTPNLDILVDRLCAGFTFAEAAYMSERVVSWMTTFVGDPLYRPYAQAELGYPDQPKDEWDAYRQGAQAWFERGPDEGAAELKRAAREFKSGLVLEGLGLLELTRDQPANAAKAFAQAAQTYRDPGDILRATIHEVFQLRALNRVPDAIALARERVAKHPRAPGAEVLQGIAAQLAESIGKPH